MTPLKQAVGTGKHKLLGYGRSTWAWVLGCWTTTIKVGGTYKGSFKDLSIPIGFITNNNNGNNIHKVVPYTRGLIGSFKSICSKHGLQVHFRGSNTIKNLLMAPKDNDKDLNPNIWQLVFGNVSVKGWIIYCYEYSFFYSSSDVLWFPSHQTEIVNTSMMAWDVAVFINRGRGFEVLFKHCSRRSCRFPNVLFITLYPARYTYISLNSSVLWYPYLWEPPGGSWLCCLLWHVFVLHVYCQCS